MEYNTSSTATFSRKFSNIHKSFNSTSIYDGVFANTSKFGVSSSFSSPVEDYTEIFGGPRESRRSSIPVLDIPALHERKVSANARSSKLDYSAIFGGDSENTASYEELLAKSNNHGSFSKEARAQAYGRSHSEASAKSIGENEVLPKEGIHISYDKVKSFNVSYNKVEPSGENGANGRTHITKLRDVPGYTCLVEETGPSKQAKNERAVTNDTSTTSDADEGLLKDSGTKTLPDQPASSNNKTQTKEGAVGCNSRHTRSMSKNFLFDGYEFGLKTDGMHSPSMDNSNSRFGTSPRRATENFSGVYSPPDFGYEVEENSLAAASAAAVKKAIEIAEARIRLAKELMEKDKEMLHGNMSYKNVIKKERRNGEMAKKLNISSGIKAKEVCDLDNKRQMMEAPGKANSMDDTLLERDTVLRQRQISSSEAGQHTHEQEYKSFQEDCQQQELEDVAVVNESNKATLISLELKQGFTMKNIIQSGYEFFARNWMRAADKPSQELVENSKSPMTVEEDLSQKKVENEQPAVEALKEGMQSERRRPDTENHEKKLATEQYNESVEMPTLLHDEGIHQKKLDVYNESALGEDLQTRELEIQMNSMKGVPGLKDNEFEQIDVYKGGEENGSRNMFDGEQGRHPSEASSMKEEDAEMQEESFETVLSESEPEGIHFIEVNKEGFVLSYAAADMSTRSHAFQELEELKEFPGGGKSSWLYDQGDLEGDNKLREGRINNNINDELKQMEVTDQQDSHECFLTERITAEINAETENETRESVDSRVDGIVTEPDDQVILEFEHRSLEVLECDRTNENVHASVNEVEEKEDVGKENISSINFKGNDENSRNIDDNHGLDESYRSDWSNIVQNVLEVVEFQEQLEEIGALGFHVNGIHNSADINEAHRDNQSTEESPMMGNEEMHSWDSSSMSDEEKHQHASVADMHQYYDDTTKSEISINGEEQAGVSINGEKLDDGFADSARCNDDINSETSDQSLFSERVEKPHNLECFNDNRWVDDDDNTNFHIEEDQLSVSSERRGETMGMQLNNLNQSFEHVSFEGKEETLVFHVETNSRQSFEKEETLEFHVETKSCQSFEKDDLYVEASEQFASSERIDKPENLECIDDSKWVHDNDSNFRIEEDGVSLSNERKNETVGLQQATRSSQCFENLPSEGKEETLQFPSIANSRQSFETNDTLKVEDRDNDSSVQKEIKQEKDQDKKIDVLKERERAREMERLAVERAIREARERAFAEARERAERAAVQKATAEARQRVTAHAREKLGKGSTDVNGRLAEKTSIEAKLRAERAAVERATAEARERALEKAMSEKFSSHDSHNKGSRPSINTQNRDSLDHNEGSDIVKGESAERRKARLERHQRTAERAAKALAEKNMRDIIAQREQAERNRMAETLDADIKRWLGGKQGNLRALLSTLQYILGPDSGWQAVSLTEIITTAAVKKAYRKATLCVHPDKLQQRGATLQQKYVCEKVFDLLKEAWNKFNAEER